jgi:hypothetical protein
LSAAPGNVESGLTQEVPVESRPIAFRHLARMHEMVTHASFVRAVTQRQLVSGPAIEQAAAADRALDEEILSLARERGWSLPQTREYEWKMVADDYNTVVPRILRVIARDVFELDEMCRRTDDEEVASLAAEVLGERRALVQALEGEHPEFALPGAK